MRSFVNIAAVASLSHSASTYAFAVMQRVARVCQRQLSLVCSLSANVTTEGDTFVSSWRIPQKVISDRQRTGRVRNSRCTEAPETVPVSRSLYVDNVRVSKSRSTSCVNGVACCRRLCVTRFIFPLLPIPPINRPRSRRRPSGSDDVHVVN